MKKRDLTEINNASKVIETIVTTEIPALFEQLEKVRCGGEGFILNTEVPIIAIEG